MSSSSQTRLMDISKSLPTYYSFKLTCSADSFTEKLKEVASFVAKVYAQFIKLNEEGRAEYSKAGVYFGHFKTPAPTSEYDEFETKLKERIIRDLSQTKTERSSIKLSTDYFPEGALHEVAKSSFQDELGLGFLFPYKTTTRIHTDRTKIELNMNFIFSAAY